jgi:hypothetical protein
MDELPPRRRWLPSPEFLVFLGVGVVATAIAIPGLLSSNRASNERNASTALKTLSSAEADYRANDRDLNNVNDFWTGDVSGLYYVKPVGGGPELRLIEESVANADAKPLFVLKNGTIPKAGYLFQALNRDDAFKGSAEEYYKKDTDKSGRKVHNREKFGFCAFPKSGNDGKYVFTVNENNTVFRDPGTEPKTSFPDDSQLKGYWSSGD